MNQTLQGVGIVSGGGDAGELGIDKEKMGSEIDKKKEREREIDGISSIFVLKGLLITMRGGLRSAGQRVFRYYSVTRATPLRCEEV